MVLSPRLALAILATAAVCAPVSAVARPHARTNVLVFAPSPADARVELVREAIAFWNQAFLDLGLEPVLGEVEVRRSTASRALETYAREISRRAGSEAAGGFAPDPPAELAAQDAGIVVLLSIQDLLPFAWPLPGIGPGTGRTFIAIDRGKDTASRSRDVIAHELGHALGLKHDRSDPAALMCMPCSRVAPRDSTWPALTARERSRLVELYGRAGEEPGN